MTAIRAAQVAGQPNLIFARVDQFLEVRVVRIGTRYFDVDGLERATPIWSIEIGDPRPAETLIIRSKLGPFAVNMSVIVQERTLWHSVLYRTPKDWDELEQFGAEIVAGTPSSFRVTRPPGPADAVLPVPLDCVGTELLTVKSVIVYEDAIRVFMKDDTTEEDTVAVVRAMARGQPVKRSKGPLRGNTDPCLSH